MTLIVDALDLTQDGSVLGGLEQFEPDGAAPDGAPETDCGTDHATQWVTWNAAAVECEWALIELAALTVAV